MEIPLARPWFTEEEAQAAYDVVKSQWVIYGPRTMEFERQFADLIGVKHAIAVNSGSTALLVAQAAAGIGPGDEVIVPDMTFITTATSCIYLGAKPVFADIDLSVYGMAPTDIERRITDRTKAIIPVHYAGQTADMSGIMDVANKHNLTVIEDAAEAHLAEYNGRKSGSIGKMGIFSFTPSKPMTTGEGGMITTDDGEMAERCRLIRNFGDCGKFEWNLLGFNFRMPEVMGAIGLAQLKKLQRAVSLRREIARRYTESFRDLASIITPYVRKSEDACFQLYTIRLKLDVLAITRDQFIKELAKMGVSSRLYYPCLHRQGVFQGLCYQRDVEFPNSMEFERTALSIPIYPQLTHQKTEYVIKVVRRTAIENTRS